MIKYINTIKINLNNYKKFLFYSLLIFITITIIQTYSSINNQLKYQEELINKVADRVSVEYQLLMSTQKSLMNEFQLKNSELLKDIYNKGASLNKEEYMKDFYEESPDYHTNNMVNALIWLSYSESEKKKILDEELDDYFR